MFLKKYKGLMQHMKGIRCQEIVSNPAFLEHTFSLFDSSPSQGPLGVELIYFEPRACILMTLSSAFMNNGNVSPHLFTYLSTKSVMAIKWR